MKQNLSENSILEIIHKHFPNADALHSLGRGDDCAVLSIDTNSSDIVITTDIFAECSHFRTSYFSPKSIGYKALAVNISDIYAMGAIPVSAQCAFSFPKNTSLEYIEKIFSSMATLAKEHNVLLSGGDLSKNDTLNITITLIGIKDKEVKLYRDNGTCGDIVFLIGEIGLSRLALHVLENTQYPIAHFPQAQHAHFYPTLHKESAMQLADFVKKYPHEKFSLMDVSDGLAQDLPRLSSQYGTQLYSNSIKLSHEIIEYCNNENIHPTEFAIQGGEDYALVGTCPSHLWEQLSAHCTKIQKIGNLVNEQGIFLDGKKLQLVGYDHFQERNIE